MVKPTVSMRPRLGAAARMAAITSRSSLASGVSTSNPMPAPTHPVHPPSHSRNSPEDPAATQRVHEAVDEQTTPHPEKRRKVMAESILAKDDTPPTSPSPAPSSPGAQNSPIHPTKTGGSQPRLIRSGRYKGLYIEDFPVPSAGAPISNDYAPPPNLDEYMRRVGPMADPDNFEVAKLLLTTNLTDAAKERHLKSKMYQGRVPWLGSDGLLADVDMLAHGPDFSQSDIRVFDGQRERPQYLIRRHIVEIIRDFLSNPLFKFNMRYAPFRLYTSPRKTERVYADMSASDWWWREMEKLIARGHSDATIVPLIISTDQTLLSVMCGGQKAYPVYVSFGNLDKEWRRKPSKHSSYLLGYLPVDGFEDVADDNERRRLKADLVHRAMEALLEPLRVASEQGVEMWCPDGRLRRIFPRVAAYTADFPEQCLQCSASEGGCPICKVTHKERGDFKFDDEIQLREREETLSALRAYIMTKNQHHLKDPQLKPVWPWWGDLPDVNLSACITPDLLHQGYQGLFKHYLFRWAKEIIGRDKLDDWFAAMPHAEGLTRYPKGTSAINSSQWTGRESKQLIAQFLPVVASGLSPEMVQLTRALVDFIYRSHAASLTESDLKAMDDDLGTFHRLKKHLVNPEGIYKDIDHFKKIAKLHMLRHWTHSIRELGTPDGYNTEGPEHLHIEFAKVPWRACNKVKPLPQMVTYIQRQEAIRVHSAYMDRYLAGDELNDVQVDGTDDQADPEGELTNVAHLSRDRSGGDVTEAGGAGDAQRSENTQNDAHDVVDDPSLAVERVYYPNPVRHMAVTPTVHNIPIQDLIDRYLAPNILPEIKAFLIRRCRVPDHDILLSSQNRVDVWHKLYLYHPPPSFGPIDPIRRDVIRASVVANNARNRSRDGVSDVALYLEKPNRLRATRETGEKHGLERYRAGRVRAFFTLPAHLRLYHPEPLAYLELFAPFDAYQTISPFSKLHSTQHDFDSRDVRRTLVVPVSDLVFACHLVPKFRKLNSKLKLNADTDLLSASRYFWLNHYYNHHLFRTIQHWRRRWRGPSTRERLVDNLALSQLPGPSSHS